MPFSLYVRLLCVCLMHMIHHMAAGVREELGEAEVDSGRQAWKQIFAPRAIPLATSFF